ncbi:MAG: C cytochrome precursor [Planctomycetaceae bacterium]|nr:C cytochrome precursor [Planctomycetaceae bacterium]
MKTRPWTIAGLLAAATAIVVFAVLRRTDDSDQLPERPIEDQLPKFVQREQFVSSNACQECHPSQHASWHRTFHRSMTQVASTESVVGDFDDVQLESRGRSYRLYKKGEEFWVNMADPDWEASALKHGADLAQIDDPPIVDRQIIMTTGSHHMQGYWIRGDNGNQLRQVPWYFIIDENRWVPREDVFMEPPGSPRHFMEWNDHCIVCHSVGGAPRADRQANYYDTQVAELGIACEACHGPGKEHVQYQRLLANGGSVVGLSDPVVNPKLENSKIASEICGQCHSTFGPFNDRGFIEKGYSYRAGKTLSDSHYMLTFEEAHSEVGSKRLQSYYWDDGTCRVGGREYLGLVKSPCFERGPMSCLSCHSLHESEPDDLLTPSMRTDDACLQCHKEMADDLEAHTHHAANSSGSLCYNCHMPHTTYALLKAIRSHRIVTPNVATSVEKGRPNACNLCHLDQTYEWTATKLNEWYEIPEPELNDDERQVAASLLWLLKGDPVQRIVAAWHMGWKPAIEATGNDWQQRFLAELLTDEYSTVRYVAGKQIGQFVGAKDWKYDFVASPAEREKSRQRAIELWGKSHALPNDSRNQRLLIKSSLKVDEERLRELKEQRDTRPITLPE